MILHLDSANTRQLSCQLKRRHFIYSLTQLFPIAISPVLSRRASYVLYSTKKINIEIKIILHKCTEEDIFSGILHFEHFKCYGII